MKTIKSITLGQNAWDVLKSRGFFSDDPQWLFNAYLVLEKRCFILKYNGAYDLEEVEYFLAKEDIPYRKKYLEFTDMWGEN
jgi:hypothetical protein